MRRLFDKKHTYIALLLIAGWISFVCLLVMAGAHVLDATILFSDSLYGFITICGVIGAVVGVFYLQGQSIPSGKLSTITYWWTVVVTVCLIAFIVAGGWNYVMLAVVGYILLLYLLWGFDKRYFIIGAAVCLRHVPRYIISGEYGIAEQFSIYMYFFLVCFAVATLFHTHHGSGR